MERVDLAQWLGLAAALGLASGVRLYAVLLVVGLAERFHWAALPPAFAPLGHPFVLVAAGFMVLVELFADKIPVLDSAWDFLHTFVRIPAGAALAAAALGGTSSTWTLVAAILGGSLAATSHFAKAGTRVAVNASPEPFSNLLVSTLEDVGVGALLWLALAHPWIALAVVAVLAVAALMLARLVWKLVAGGVRRLFGRRADAPAGPAR